MLLIILSEMHQNLIVTKCAWIQWMFLYFMVSGTRSLVEVHQPPLLTTSLGHDVMMPCQLSLSQKKMVIPPVLYWAGSTQNTSNAKLWIPSEEYERRVDLLDNNPNSLNKSILLKNVQWADSGTYLCKLSVTIEIGKSFRRRGNGTLLMVYDTMIFNLTSHSDSLLWCEVNVTQDPRFVLSIAFNGCILQTVNSAPGDAAAALPYTTLSETTSLRGGGKYECQLHLNKDLIAKSIFHYHPTVAEEGGDPGKNVSATCSITASELSVAVFPEPWFLYVALLLVPITILLGILAAWLMCRR